MSRALTTNISYFYEGLADSIEPAGSNLPRESMQDFLLTPEGIELAAVFPKIAKAGSAARPRPNCWPASRMRWNLRVCAQGTVEPALNHAPNACLRNIKRRSLLTEWPPPRGVRPFPEPAP